MINFFDNSLATYRSKSTADTFAFRKIASVGGDIYEYTSMLSLDVCAHIGSIARNNIANRVNFDIDISSPILVVTVWYFWVIEGQIDSCYKVCHLEKRLKAMNHRCLSKQQQSLWIPLTLFCFAHFLLFQ